MDLPLLSGGTPDTKPWCNIVANSVVTNKYSAAYEVGRGTYVVVAGSGLQNLTPAQFVSGIAVYTVGATKDIVCPSSASIDAYLDIKDDGYLIKYTVINRSITGNQNLNPPNAGPAQLIPIAATAGKCPSTDFYFTRISGIWTCINS